MSITVGSGFVVSANPLPVDKDALQEELQVQLDWYDGEGVITTERDDMMTMAEKEGFWLDLTIDNSTLSLDAQTDVFAIMRTHVYSRSSIFAVEEHQNYAKCR